LARLSCREKKILQKPEWVAGDAVMIAPVSSQIPCKQGIFQGNSESQLQEARPHGENTSASNAFLMEFPEKAIKESISLEQGIRRID
jgi:hypothetical protein